MSLPMVRAGNRESAGELGRLLEKELYPCPLLSLDMPGQVWEQMWSQGSIYSGAMSCPGMVRHQVGKELGSLSSSQEEALPMRRRRKETF